MASRSFVWDIPPGLEPWAEMPPDHGNGDTVIVPSPFRVTRRRAKTTQPRFGVRTHHISLPSGRTTRP